MESDLESEKRIDAIDVVDGDLALRDDTATIVKPREAERRRAYTVYIYLPLLFLTTSLLGGLRFSSTDGTFIFLRPSLACLIFAAMLMVLFARAGLIKVARWFSEERPLVSNIANGVVIASVFAASTQIFNSLIPEQGLPYWIVTFCFFWTLWNNLFADFDTKKLLRSLGALFGLAFVVKYLVLANLAAPDGRTWFERLTENPGQEAM